MKSDSLCPYASEETAEAYLTGELSAAEEHRFEDHYILCRECTDRLESTDRFIRSIRAAGEVLEGSAPSKEVARSTN